MLVSNYNRKFSISSRNHVEFEKELNPLDIDQIELRDSFKLFKWRVETCTIVWISHTMCNPLNTSEKGINQ